MARRPGTDERQPDFFGAPAPKPEAPPARPSRQGNHERGAKDRASPPELRGVSGDDEPEKLAAGLSPAELGDFVVRLPDDALARLVVAAVRQLRRRLARRKGSAGKGKSPVLDRAVREIVAELGGEGDDDGSRDRDG